MSSALRIVAPVVVVLAALAWVGLREPSALRAAQVGPAPQESEHVGRPAAPLAQRVGIDWNALADGHAQGAHAGSELTLVVLDEDGADVPDVRLVRCDRFTFAGQRPPSPHTRAAWRGLVAEGEASPVTLDRHWLEHALWAGAPGREWVRIPEPPVGESEVRVMLRPAGEIAVQLVDRDERDRLVVRVRPRGSEEIVVEWAARGGFALLEGVAAGSFDVGLESGLAGGVSYDTMAGELSAGGRLDVCLAAPAPIEIAEGRLAGRLVVPAEARELGIEQQLALRIHPLERTEHHRRRGVLTLEVLLDDMTRVPGTDTWEWSVERDLPPGRYAVDVTPLAWREECELFAGESTRLELVGELAHTLVTFRDARSGERILIEAIDATRAEGVLPPRATVLWRADWEAFEVVSAPGPMALRVRDARYSSKRVTLDALEGWNDVDVSLSPAVRVRLAAADSNGPVTVAPDFWWGVEVAPLDKSGELLGRSVRGGHGRGTSLQLELASAARYELRFPGLDGYRPIASREVTVRERGEHDLQIDLEALGQ